MTLRDRRAFLWDMLEAARSIKTFVEGKTLEDYQQDELLRSGVERQFLIIGEALSQPPACSRISRSRSATPRGSSPFAIV